MLNTFVIYDCSKRKNILITQSARKAKEAFYVGTKIEVWSNNLLVETIYLKNLGKINKYIDEQKKFIHKKQMEAQKRNKRRNCNG